MSKKFKRGDMIIATTAVDDRQWEIKYGTLPKNTILTVSHLSVPNGNCVHPFLPEGWEGHECTDYRTGSEKGLGGQKAYGYGFYNSQYRSINEILLPEELFNV